MEEKKEIYRGRAVVIKDEKQTIKALIKAAVFCLLIFALSVYVPFGWVLEIAALVLSALYINRILKQGTFVSTYILYEDTLVVLTRYGLIELETARYDLNEAVFTETSVTSGGKTRPFHPDEKLKSLLLK